MTGCEVMFDWGNVVLTSGDFTKTGVKVALTSDDVMSTGVEVMLTGE